ncbi:MAG: TIM barrel protein, partial [Oscillospiraceae bacterium]|nr:TIM barrel protein [Oscillospiraceae bacterium]
MKTLFNQTTSSFDMERYSSREHFLSTLDGFDGVELMYIDEDTRGIVPKDKVVGLHMTFPTYWLDFWRGEFDCVEWEFSTLENAYKSYGGRDRTSLINMIRSEYAHAVDYGAEYMVFHATDCSFRELLSGNYLHSDEEVVDALCEMLNEALPCSRTGPALLLENLWEPGMRLTRPEITQSMMDGIRYPNVGIMLDTGHLMHTEPAIRTQEEALRYIERCLDEHGELCRYIRGIHLHQSITGEFVTDFRRNIPPWPETYEQRMEQLFTYVFQVDLE